MQIGWMVGRMRSEVGATGMARLATCHLFLGIDPVDGDCPTWFPRQMQ
jgi:hypothetical protein